MDILLSGTITQVLQGKSGVSQSGTQWARQPYVIEHEHGQYPKRMVFDVCNARIQEFNLQLGEEVTLHLNCDAREYPQGSGKYFNTIEAWKVERQQTQQTVQQPPVQQQPQTPQNQPLPFPPAQ